MSALLGALAGALVGLAIACAALALGPPGPPGPNRAFGARLRAVAASVDRAGLRALLALGGAVGAATLTGWPAAVVLAAVGGWAAPTLAGRRTQRQATVDRTEALAGWAELLRDLLTAGIGVAGAVGESARVAPVAIRPAVRALADRLGANVPTDVAFGAFAAEMADPVADLVALALTTAERRQSGRVADALAAAARAGRAQVAMRTETEAARASTYTSGRVVVVVFALFAGGQLVFNRGFLDPFGTPAGQVVLAVIGGLFAFAAASVHRLATPAPPPRFFPTPVARQEVRP